MVEPLGCRSLFGRGNGVACLEETSGLCGKRTLPPQGTPTARDDTVYSLEVVCFVADCLFPKDWITGQARDDKVFSPGMACFGVTYCYEALKDWITAHRP